MPSYTAFVRELYKHTVWIADTVTSGCFNWCDASRMNTIPLKWHCRNCVRCMLTLNCFHTSIVDVNLTLRPWFGVKEQRTLPLCLRIAECSRGAWLCMWRKRDKKWGVVRMCTWTEANGTKRATQHAHLEKMHKCFRIIANYFYKNRTLNSNLWLFTLIRGDKLSKIVKNHRKLWFFTRFFMWKVHQIYVLEHLSIVLRKLTNRVRMSHLFFIKKYILNL